MKHTILAAALGVLSVTVVFGALLGGARTAAATGADLGWGTPAPLVNHVAGDATSVGVAMDPNGNAVAGWIHQNGQRGLPSVNTYLEGAGWSIPTLLTMGPDSANAGYRASVAMDAAGDAIAVWSETWYVMASRYTPGTGWSPAQSIGYCCSWSADPVIAMNPAGDAFVAWWQWDNVQYSIFANHYVAGSGWTGAVWLEGNDVGSAYAPRVGVDDAGDAIVVWYEWDGTSLYRIDSNRYVVGSGWTGQTYVSPVGVYAYYPDVVVNRDGSAVALYVDGWLRWVPFSPGTGWGAVGTLDSAGFSVAYAPRIASDGVTGDAIAAWVRSEASGYNLYSSNFAAATSTWSAPFLREGQSAPVSNQVVAMNRAGRAILAWQQSDGTVSQIYAWRYDPGTGWVGIYSPSGSLPGDKLNPAVAMSDFGTGVLAYQQKDGTRFSIRSNRFTGSSFSFWTAVEWDNAGGDYSHRIAANAAGQAAVVWWQNDGVVSNMYGATYNPASGWTAPSLLESDNRGNAVDADVAVDSAGNAFAVWTQWNGYWNIWSARYTPTGGWEAPYLMETLDADAGLARVAFDAAGNAFAVWYQWDPAVLRIYGSTWSSGTGWTPAVPLEGNPGNAAEPHIAVTPSGTALVAWHQYDGSYDSIYYVTYTPGTGWSAPALAENLAAWSDWCRIAMNDAGQAILIWHVWNGVAYDLWANRWDGGAWTGETLIENEPGWVSWPEIAIDGQGNGLAAWYAWDGSEFNVYRVEYRNGAWQPAELLTPGARDAIYPAVAADRYGSMMVSWAQWDGLTYEIQTQRYIAGAGWSATAPMQVAGKGSQYPRLAVDGAGDVLTVYLQYDGERWLPWVNRFTVRDGAPRLDITSPTTTLTNNPVVTIAGYTDPGAQVTIDGTSVAVDASGFFGASLIWPDGPNTVRVVATNLAGNSRTQLVSFTVDTVPPSLVITSPLFALTNRPNVWVSGVTEPGASVDVDGVRATVDALGNFGLTEGMAEGGNTFVVTATDAAGNTETRAFTVTLDTIPPPLTIASPNGGATDNPSVTVSGQTEAGASLTIDGATTTVNPDGTFSRAVNLPDGAHTFAVVASDAAGNTATASPSVTVDTAAPGLAISSPVTGTRTNVAVVTVTGQTDATARVVVNGIAVANVAGTFSVPLALTEGANTITATATDAAGNTATASVTITLDTRAPSLAVTSPPNGALTNNPVLTMTGTTEPGALLSVDAVPVSVGPSGTWTYTTNLVQGAHTFAIVATDSAGNDAVLYWTVTLDTTPPALQVLSPQTNSVTSNPVVDVTGIAEPGARVVVDGVQAAVDGSGNFAVPRVLREGSNTIRVTATDAAGNTASTQTSVTLDTTPPTLTLATPTDGTVTRNPAVQVRGHTDVGATLTVDGTPVTVAADGSFTTTVNLPEGAHVFSIVASDNAGNAVSAEATVTVDSTPPALTIVAPASGASTADASVVVIGISEAGARLVINGLALGVAADGSFSARVALAPGANTITATATDAAGNTATQTVSVTYNDPTVGLRTDLTNTQNNLTTTRNDLETTKNDLATTQGDLTATRQSLASLGTEALGLLVLAGVALVLGILQFVQICGLRRQMAASSPRRTETKPPEETEPPT